MHEQRHGIALILCLVFLVFVYSFADILIHNLVIRLLHLTYLGRLLRISCTTSIVFSKERPTSRLYGKSFFWQISIFYAFFFSFLIIMYCS